MPEEDKFWLYGPPTIRHHIGPYDPEQETWEEYLERREWLIEKLDAVVQNVENLSHEEKIASIRQTMIGAYGPDWDKPDDEESPHL